MLNAPLDKPAPGTAALVDSEQVIPRIELTDTLHIFMAAQHLALVEACQIPGRKSLFKEQLEARVRQMRQQLYSLTLSDLKRAGYDPTNCTEPTVTAEVSGPQRHLRLFLEWIPLVGGKRLGGVIPNDEQPTQIPVYIERFEVVDADNQIIGQLNSEDGPLLATCMNVLRWLMKAIKDASQEKLSPKEAVNHWRAVAEGVRRMTAKLNVMQHTWMPLIPENLSDLFRPMSVETVRGFNESLASVTEQQRGAYQFLVNILRSAMIKAELQEKKLAGRNEIFVLELEATAEALANYCARAVAERVPGAARWRPLGDPSRGQEKAG